MNHGKKEVNPELQEKIKEWKQLRRKHFKLEKSRSTSKTGLVRELPPGHVRQIIKSHGDMSHAKFAGQKRLYLGALRYAPHAVLKLIENMPMPWEEIRNVRILYHSAGAVTFVNEVPRVIPPQYIAQWATMWIAMRREKRDRSSFERIRFPPFDDNEPPLDFVSNIEGIQPPEAVLLELDPDEDSAVYDWFYDHLGLHDSGFVNGISYKKWRFPLATMSTLYRLSTPIVDGYQDPSTQFLFDVPSLLTSKALNEAIPGGPRFEPLFRDGDTNDEWNEFNDINKVIIRIPISTEYRIAFPHLYNNRPRKVSVAPYLYPPSAFEDLQSPEIPVFTMPPNVVTISWDRSRILPPPKEEYLPPLTIDFDPLFSDLPLEPPNTYDTLSLFFAPPPFNARSGMCQRAEDVPLLRSWYNRKAPMKAQVKVRVSYQKLLKNYIMNKAHHEKVTEIRRKGSRKLLSQFKSTPVFHSTTLDWVEAGLQVIQQGFNMCNLLIKRHRLAFLNLDYNFNLKPIKTLNTKERRASRFGNGYHLMREFFRFTKLLVDCHIQYRLGSIDAYVLADGIQYVLTHAGHLTGMYRYKYKLMHQVRTCKDLKHVIYSRFNLGSVGKGPGCGFWGPMWRVWVFFLRGMTPLMERWLNSRISREYEGRVAKKVASTVTKQRMESHFDLEMRAAAMHDITAILPPHLQNKAQTVMAHLSEAWRCWKANIPWKVPNLPPALEAIILRYVKLKADWWTSNAHYARSRIEREGTVDKGIVRKNTGRLTRLYFKEQTDIQATFKKEGPFLEPDKGSAMIVMMSNWLQSRKFQVIPFPPMQYKHDTKILLLALEYLRFGHDVTMRINQNQREENALIEEAHDNPHEALNRIKRMLYTQRAFKEVKLSFLEHYTRLIPVYEVDAIEKITDAYLDNYLWYEADKRLLFPNWIKPSDSEPPPVLIRKWCEAINNLHWAWETEQGQCMVLAEVSLEQFYNKIDLTFLNYMLRLVVDHNLADYMTSKNNVKITFKDMSFLNSYGIIHGLQFTSFIFQYMGLLADLLILGLRRASELAGPPENPNPYLQFQSLEDEVRHPIKCYQRYAKRIHILYKFTEEEAGDLIKDYLTDHPDQNNENIVGYPNKTCWPRDARMRLVKHDVNLGRAVFNNIKNKIPPAIVNMEWDHSFVSVYSKDNPNLLFYMCGFEVRILPKCRMQVEDFTPMDGVWDLQDKKTQERTAYVFLKVSKKAITYFRNRTRQILLSSQATTFGKVANKWNTHLMSLVVYFREALVSSPEVLDQIVRCENNVQTRVKLGLNSRMPNRFPPVIFYAPKEFGGLGFFSMGHVLIPQADLRWSKQTTLEPTHFRSGMDHVDHKFLPALYRYVQSWEGEIRDSDRVWSHYAEIKKIAALQNRKINIDDLEGLWDHGIPRINTIYQKDRHTLAYDKGWRSRLYFKRYSLFKTNPFAWTYNKHDGKLWNFYDYRADVIQALGGPENILSHTLFAATGFKHWEGLFWDNQTGFEEALKTRKLTNAQRLGLCQVPNRRFTLWWSPTINRANVYVGFQVQLDLTGIFMHGKIPSLKISMIQLFRAHMWQKIHESIVMDITQILDSNLQKLNIESVVKPVIHPRKSYKMNSSCADIIMTSINGWSVSDIGFINERLPIRPEMKSTRFWFDVQLRWGDYDSHDIERYARSLFQAYTQSPQSTYPTATGVIIAIDLCYNIWSAYGTWIPGLQDVIQEGMKKIMEFNPSLSVLRERCRKALQLYASDPEQPALNSSNFGELFGTKTTWIVDDSNVYRVKIQKSFSGNYLATPVNGAVFILNPATGQLFMKIIHTDAWKQQKRLQQLSKWKGAEETAALVRVLPPEEQPNTIICTRELLLDPVQQYLTSFPNITVKGSDMYLPFKSYMKIPKLSDLVVHSSEPKMCMFNLYDDWKETVSPYTCFSRLMLILRALSVKKGSTWDILRPTGGIETAPDHVWPTHTPEEWEEIEKRLKDLVVEDYATTNNIAANALTQTEVRDIILGIKIAPPSEERQQLAQEQANITATTSRTTNADGQQIVTQTLSAYEQQRFQSRGEWRARCLQAANMNLRTARINAPPDALADSQTIVLPLNLLRRFVEVADPRVQVAALLYGREARQDPEKKEVYSFILPPQYGTQEEGVKFPPFLPEGEPEELSGLTLMGWIHTAATDSASITPEEAIRIANIYQKNHLGVPPPVVSVSFVPGATTVRAFRLTDAGLEWAIQNVNTGDRAEDFSESFAERIPVLMAETYHGWFMLPKGDSDLNWNLNFNSLKLNNFETYEVQQGLPLPFFHMKYRVNHFLESNNPRPGVVDNDFETENNFS